MQTLKLMWILTPHSSTAEFMEKKYCSLTAMTFSAKGNLSQTGKAMPCHRLQACFHSVLCRKQCPWSVPALNQASLQPSLPNASMEHLHKPPIYKNGDTVK